MYSTCLFCHRPLGANGSVERFPVGRRLAFDAGKGRLWVVCARCERWNLSPLEERWEAIEECERLFRDSKRRVSTDQIGLARLAEGLELVRIGRPERPEFAAWRYGDQFGRRRLQLVLRFITRGSPHAPVAHLPVGPEGRGRIVVERRHVDATSIWSGHEAGSWWIGVRHRSGFLSFVGEEAIRASRLLLPALNWRSAPGAEVRAAIAVSTEHPDPDALFRHVAHRAQSRVVELRPALRLALEMAAHEEVERRAMEGELALLEEEWRDAERIAAIADGLLVPAAVEERLRGEPPP